MEYILSIDQGTTGTRAILINKECEFICSDYMEHNQIFPKPGWVEHDPEEIWRNTQNVTRNVLTEVEKREIDLKDIKGIGIANQGETVMLWDKNTGQPLYNAIVWQCRRTADEAEKLKAIPGFEKVVKDRTGLLIDAYFSATKIKWIIDNVKGVKEKLEKDEVLAGTLDTWLIWKMTGGKSHVTDCSTAARTMLFNINELNWDNEILNIIGIPRKILADVLPTSGDFGVTDANEFCGLTVPICGSVVDQPGALFGQACFEEGMVKNTYGTGCFLYMNTGDKPIPSEKGLLSTIAWKIGDEVKYAFDGGIYIAGAAIQWLRDGIGLIKEYSETETMAKSIPDTGGVYFVPAFAGLAAPYWDQYARGTIVGMTAGTKKEHIVRATLESIAFQVKNVVDCMEEDSGKKIKVLRVDGGITKNDFLMQFQADILGIPVEVPQITETTALGAAFLAGLSCGVWESKEDIKNYWKLKKRYEPSMDVQKREKLMKAWNEAVKRSMGWEKC